MAKVRLKIEGRMGEMSPDSMIAVLQNFLWVLRDLDRRLSDTPNGSLKWVISDVKKSSLDLELQSINRNPRKQDYGRQVGSAFASGLATIQKKQEFPDNFSIDAMEHVFRAVRAFERNGVSGVAVTAPNRKKPVSLNRDTTRTLQELVGVHHKGLGSIEGKIELVGVHTGNRKFNLYHHISGRPVRCNLPTMIEPDVWKAAQESSRVIVTGIISYNSKGQPIRIDVQRDIRFLGRKGDLPTSDDLLGSTPDITGALSTEDYIRSIRDA